ncbi:ATP-dependent RNA helicase DED1 [Striga asiatica]|uniref:ATP-dependent RNA helicase DED1 n=1 Tax=Striga asiatica TaxID=4170 RepID=A0A5A7PVN2_STRAF|nr:ATP-dependent RNA helicase DED1 [Striga asiatica]
MEMQRLYYCVMVMFGLVLGFIIPSINAQMTGPGPAPSPSSDGNFSSRVVYDNLVLDIDIAGVAIDQGIAYPRPNPFQNPFPPPWSPPPTHCLNNNPNGSGKNPSFDVMTQADSSTNLLDFPNAKSLPPVSGAEN